MSNDIAITSQPGATVGTAAAIFSPEGMNQLVRFAELMSQSKAKQLYRNILKANLPIAWR